MNSRFLLNGKLLFIIEAVFKAQLFDQLYTIRTQENFFGFIKNTKNIEPKSRFSPVDTKNIEPKNRSLSIDKISFVTDLAYFEQNKSSALAKLLYRLFFSASGIAVAMVPICSPNFVPNRGNSTAEILLTTFMTQ